MRHFFTVTFFGLIIKFLGLLRTNLTQKLIGASFESDCFLLAFRLIGFFRRIFTDGSFGGVFTTYFAEYKKENKEWGFSLGVLIVFTSIFSIITLLFCLFPVFFTQICMGSFKINKKILLVSKYAKYMFSLAFLMFMSSFLTAILNFNKHFFHSSFSLVLGSMFNVFCIYLGIKTKTIFFPLVIGTIGYQLLHVLYMLFILVKKYNFFTGYFFSKKFFKSISSMGFFQFINQIITLLFNFLFFRLKSGDFSYVEYGERITQFVFMLVAANLSSVISPLLAKNKHSEKFQEYVKKFFFFGSFAFIFPTIFMFFKSDMIVNLLYSSNKNTNIIWINQSLKISSLAIPFWCSTRLLETFLLTKFKNNSYNIGYLIYNITYLCTAVKLLKYGFIGCVWSLNLGIFARTLYLLYQCHIYNILSINYDLILNIFYKILWAFLLIKYVHSYFFIFKSIWINLSGILFMFLIYAMIFQKDFIMFFSKEL
ncbi:hypothetical protein AB836_01235 [Rickettsiales bacterium (ex Bugula neritina AB1)]|nr:hypothetical protein AB836_01235 [Rickettsiales bacterium (ex Bugula neritina AB1)]